MIAGKWNIETQKYDYYTVPEGATLYEYDHGKEIICANCATAVTYGEAYTSRMIHNSAGFGFMVCSECKDMETTEKALELQNRLKEDTLDRIADNREMW